MTEEEFRDWEAAVRCESPRQAAQPAKNVADGVYWDKSGDKWMSGPMLMDWVRQGLAGKIGRKEVEELAERIGKAIASEKRRTDKALEAVIAGMSDAAAQERSRLQAELEALRAEIAELRQALPLRAVSGKAA